MSEPALAPTTVPATPRPRAAARQAWVERLQRFADAGLSPARFCAAEGVSLPSFYAWSVLLIWLALILVGLPHLAFRLTDRPPLAAA